MPQNLKTLLTQSFAPKITNVSAGSTTAVLPAGGQTVTVTGVGFQANAVIYINNTNVSATVANSTSLTFTTIAQTVGSYQLSVLNGDGSVAFKPGGLVYFDAPVWSTSSGALPSAPINLSYTTTLVATGGTITYSISSGSLPTGLSLNSSSGVISGTPTVQNDFNFTVAATNQYNQVTTRSFSISVVSAPSTIEVLMVAGGGGGSFANDGGGGGAGAGGLLYSASFAVLSGTTYNLVIGAGGPNQTNGSNTTGFGATAIGGGRAGGGPRGGQYAGGNGGSGGGGSGFDGYTAAGTATQGNSNGMIGYGNNGGPAGSGSGGGAGAAGTAGGVGGIGRQYSISGTATYYAGGGGAPGQAGGLGGGAAGVSNTNGNSGAANSGGGAGAIYEGGSTTRTGGSGGSGVIIVKYADTFAPATTTGSPTYTVSGGFRVYQFNGSGSIAW